MINITEAEILVRCRMGDKHAYGWLVKKYMKRAYFTAMGYLHNHENALDISQEAFIKAWRSIKKFDPDKNFFTWYYKILKNLCLNAIRNKKNHARPFSEIAEFDPDLMRDEHTKNPPDQFDVKELRGEVWKAINNLKENDREIILLREFQELSYMAIAEILECPVGTVMSRLHSARKALKENLKHYFL